MVFLSRKGFGGGSSGLCCWGWFSFKSRLGIWLAPHMTRWSKASDTLLAGWWGGITAWRNWCPSFFLLLPLAPLPWPCSSPTSLSPPRLCKRLLLPWCLLLQEGGHRWEAHCSGHSPARRSHLSQGSTREDPHSGQFFHVSRYYYQLAYLQLIIIAHNVRRRTPSWIQENLHYSPIWSCL